MLITSSKMNQKQNGGGNLYLQNIGGLLMVMDIYLNCVMGAGGGAFSEGGLTGQ